MRTTRMFAKASSIYCKPLVSRQRAALNAVMTATYWEIGRRIVESEMRGENRAEYGEKLVEQLAKDLTRRFGRGFGRANLWQMRGFYRTWPERNIVQTPSGQFANSAAGSTISDITAVAEPLPVTMVRLCTAALGEKPRGSPILRSRSVALRMVGSPARPPDWQPSSNERIALSHNKTAMLEKAGVPQSGDAISPEEAIKDPFILEFLNLKDEYSESELEEALIQHLADFLLELGDDFAFLGRQRRLRLDDNWFRIDLIFFHRRLRCFAHRRSKKWASSATLTQVRCTSISITLRNTG